MVDSIKQAFCLCLTSTLKSDIYVTSPKIFSWVTLTNNYSYTNAPESSQTQHVCFIEDILLFTSFSSFLFIGIWDVKISAKIAVLDY